MAFPFTAAFYFEIVIFFGLMESTVESPFSHGFRNMVFWMQIPIFFHFKSYSRIKRDNCIVRDSLLKRTQSLNKKRDRKLSMNWVEAFNLCANLFALNKMWSGEIGWNSVKNGCFQLKLLCMENGLMDLMQKNFRHLLIYACNNEVNV